MKFKPKVILITGVSLFIIVTIALWTNTNPFLLIRNTSMSPGVELSASEPQPLPTVEVIKPKRVTMSETQTIPGDIFPYQQAVLYAKVAGYLQEIYYDIGDWVKKGEVIARIAVPEMKKQLQQEEAHVSQWRAALQKAEAELQLRELIFQRLASVQEQSKDMVSQEQVDEARGQWEIARGEIDLIKARIDEAKAKLEETRVMLGYAEIRAPFDGVITQRWVDPGAMIQVSSPTNVSPVVEMMDMQRVRVRFYIPEPDVPLLQPGDKVVIHVPELADHSLESTVTRCAGALDIKTKSMLTEVELENLEKLLHPGMHVRVTVYLTEHSDAVVIPVEAITTEKKDTYVYAVDQDIIKKIPIHLGIDDSVVVEVASGLSGEEKVVTKGLDQVAPGDRVQVNLTKDW